MIIVDKPYISPSFTQMLHEHQLPVIRTSYAGEVGLSSLPSAISEQEAARRLMQEQSLRLYATSENAIGWIAEHLSGTALPQMIETCKNKVLFRDLTAQLFPDLFYTSLDISSFDDLSIDEIPMPCIIKPAAGFFSMGVHTITSAAQWQETAGLIRQEMRLAEGLYPKEVLDAERFIIEGMITGEEYAVDAYYDSHGSAVIVGIYKHVFASEDDVSDRVYSTSKELIEEHVEEFTVFLDEMGTALQVRDFPVHVELRIDTKGHIVPIEVNPMRFGGWCTTSDLTTMAFGFNPYLAYLRDERPHWPTLLAGTDGQQFSIVVLDNSTGYDTSQIRRFDHEALLKWFSHPLELRKIDHTEYPVFAFLFVQTDESTSGELDRILRSSLREFIVLEDTVLSER
jgi:hypothetical protein